MLDIVPAWPVMAAFTLASVLLVLSPGPDMVLYLGRTVTHGRRAGLVTLAGTSTGTLVHTLLAALGLSALLASSPWAFAALKVIGAGYLLYLAVTLLRGDPHRRGPGSDGTPPPSALRLFAGGLWVNLLNPKMVMFFLTFLPQFVTAQDPYAAGKLVFLGLYFVAVATIGCALIVLVAGRAAQALNGSQRFAQLLRWALASVMGAFAVRVLWGVARD